MSALGDANLNICTTGGVASPWCGSVGAIRASAREKGRSTGLSMSSATVEKVYVACALVYLSGAFVGLSDRPHIPSRFTPSNPGELALTIVVFLLGGIFILRSWRSFVRGLRDCKWVLVLIGLALTSSLWAPDPIFAFQKAVITAATTAIGIYFGSRFRQDDQVDILSYTLTLLGAMSVIMVVWFPQYGIDHFFSSGAWRGVFVTKNTLAKAMVLGALAVCVSSRKGLKDVLARFVWVAGFGALIVLSRSATAFVVGAVLLVLTLTGRILRSRLTVLVPTVVATLFFLAGLFTVFADQRDLLLAALGRDPTLTGRTDIWKAVLVEIGKRPLLGYGFGSFWHGLAGPSMTVVAAVHWITPHAHNGFLDLCLDLGVLGLLTFGIGFMLRFRTAILDYRASRHRAAMWPLAFLTFLLLYNLTDTSLLYPPELYWMLYAAVTVRGVREVHECPA
jgi:exopolysaccharide production protein ExoQ